MAKKLFSATTFFVWYTLSVQSQICQPNQFYNSQSLSCQQCDSSCDQWCVGPLPNQCLSCNQPGLFKDLDSWTCVATCPSNSYQVSIPREDFSLKSFKFCRTQNYYVDPDSTDSNIELGTRQYPYKALDDPFREMFHYLVLQEPNVTVYVKMGSNLTMHQSDMPLPYYNSLTEKQKGPLTIVKIYDQKYYRPPSSFSPMVKANFRVSPYDLQILTQQGVSNNDAFQFSTNKFRIFKSALKIENLHFIELQGNFQVTNALFIMGKCSSKIIQSVNCTYEVQGLMLFSVDGANIQINGGSINVSRMTSISIYGTNSDCVALATEGMVNNFELNGVTVYGTSETGTSLLTSVTGLGNFTISNSIFMDMQWPSNQKELTYQPKNEQCPFTVYTKIIFENNTIINSKNITTFGLSLQVSLPQFGFQTVSIRNNHFNNVKVSKTSIFQVSKSAQKNQLFIFENNSFDKVIFMDDSGVLTSQGEGIQIRNITVTNSYLNNAFDIQNNIVNMERIQFSNIIGNSPSKASSAFIKITNAIEAKIKEVRGHRCIFKGSRLVSLVSSLEVDMSYLEVQDSVLSENYVLYLQGTQGFIGESFSFLNITQSSSNQLFMVVLSQTTPYSDGIKILGFNFTSLRYQDSTIPLFNLQGIIETEKKGPVNINFKNLSMYNNTAQSQFFRIQPFIYSNLLISVKESVIQNNSVLNGALFFLNNRGGITQISNSNLTMNKGLLVKSAAFGINYIGESQTIQLSNCIMLRNNGGNDAILYITTDSMLVVKNSTFQDNFSKNRGSVILAEGKNAQALLSYCNLTHNYAYRGGLFFSQIGARIVCQNCIVKENFAIQGGVTYVQNDGSVEFVNSRLFQNAALEASLAYSINSYSELVFGGGMIYRNGLFYAQIELKLDALWFLNISASVSKLEEQFDPLFVNLLQQNKGQVTSYARLNQNSQNPQVQLIKAQLKLTGNLLVEDQIQLFQAQSQSSVFVDKISYVNSIGLSSNLFQLDQSTLQVSQMTIRNVSSYSYLIKADQISTLNLTKLQAMQLMAPLASVQDSFLSLEQSLFDNITDNDESLSVISLINSEALINNTTIRHVQSNYDGKSFIQLIRSKVSISNLKAYQFQIQLIGIFNSFLSMNSSEISNITMLSQTGLAISAYESSTYISHSKFHNIKGQQGSAVYSFSQAALYSQSQSLNITHCMFDQVSSLQDGGAIMAENMDMFLYNSTFSNNQALNGKGGSTYLACQDLMAGQCKYEISQNIFNDSTAIYGGALYYDLYQPQGLNQNTYINNKALYGQDYASIPFKLKLTFDIESLFDILASGQSIDQEIEVGVYDQDDQLVNSLNNSMGVLQSNDLQLSVAGNTKVMSDNGKYKFSGIQLIAKPNYNTTLVVSSDSIVGSMVQKVTGQQFQDFSIPVFFRSCVLGEVNINNQCFQCPKGTYSLNLTDTNCKPCPANAFCPGNNSVIINPGYFRSSNLTVIIFKCFQQSACLGGTNSECAYGYQGKFCGECGGTDDGKIFAQTGGNKCVTCQTLGLQILKLLGISFLIFIYIAFLLFNVLSSQTRDKPQSVLIKILTNYFQSIMIIKGFEMNWPKQVEQALENISFVSSSQQDLFSLECVIKNGKLSMNTIYLKTIFFGVLPIALTLLFSLGWVIVDQVMKMKQKTINLKNNIIATFYVITYLLYPSIVQVTFNLLQCYTYDDGKPYLKNDLSIQCWTSGHVRSTLFIAIPIIIIWVAGFPCFIFIQLYKNRQDLDKKDVMSRYGLFLVGLNDNAYYWEILVNNMKKVIFVVCASVIGSAQSSEKALIGIMVLFIINQLINHLKPYCSNMLNSMELVATYAAQLVMIGGLFFMSEDVQENNNLTFGLFMIILLFNIGFYVFWLVRAIQVYTKICQKRLQKLSTFIKSQSIRNNSSLSSRSPARKNKKPRIGLKVKVIEEEEKDNDQKNSEQRSNLNMTYVAGQLDMTNLDQSVADGYSSDLKKYGNKGQSEKPRKRKAALRQQETLAKDQFLTQKKTTTFTNTDYRLNEGMNEQ